MGPILAKSVALLRYLGPTEAILGLLSDWRTNLPKVVARLEPP
jgi:hypothetical protein